VSYSPNWIKESITLIVNSIFIMMIIMPSSLSHIA